MTDTTATKTVVIPEIFTKNTYFYTPSRSASSRRANEKKYTNVFDNFMAANAEAIIAAGLTIRFSYSESCHNVYKTFQVFRTGKGGELKRSNVTALRKALGIVN